MRSMGSSSILDNLQLSDHILLKQDMIDVPDTLYVVINEGKKDIVLVLTDDKDILNKHIAVKADIIIDSDDVDNQNPYVQSIQQAIGSYTLQPNIPDKDRIIKSLGLFSILHKAIELSQKQLINTIKFDELQPIISKHIAAIDTYIAKTETLEFDYDRTHTTYKIANDLYQKNKNQYKAHQKLLGQKKESPNTYWVELHKAYQANLKDLSEIERAEKDLLETINSIRKEIETIESDQRFLSDFDTLIQKKSDDRTKKKLLSKKENILLKYQWDFDSRLESAYARLELNKKDLPYRRDLRNVILQQQDDCITQLVVLHEPATQLEQDMHATHKKLDATIDDLKWAEHETRRAYRKLQSVRYMDKMLSLLTEEKKIFGTKSTSLNNSAIWHIKYLIQQIDLFPTEHLAWLRIMGRYRTYKDIVHRASIQWIAIKKDEAPQTYAYPLSDKQYNTLYTSIEEDFVYMQHKKPSLYDAHKQIYESENSIIPLKLQLTAINKQFVWKDKNSNKHEAAVRPTKNEIAVHESLIKESQNKIRETMTYFSTNHAMMENREKALQQLVSSYEQLIFRTRNRIKDMLAWPIPQDTSPHIFDIDKLGEELKNSQKIMEQAKEEQSLSTNILYHHMLEIPTDISHPLASYVQQLLDATNYFVSKPTKSTPQHKRITAEEKVLLQRSYKLLGLIHNKLYSLVEHIEFVSTLDDLQNNKPLHDILKDLEKILESTKAYISST